MRAGLKGSRKGAPARVALKPLARLRRAAAPALRWRRAEAEEVPVRLQLGSFPIPFVILAALAPLAGCGGHSASRSASTTAPVTSGGAAGGLARPSASVQTPASPAGAQVTIDYALADPDGDLVDVRCEYSIDDGHTFQTASDAGAGAGSEGKDDLAASAAGSSHTFVWDSAGDLGANLRGFVRFRITPSDAGGEGTAATSATFTVDATAIAGQVYSLLIPLDPGGDDAVAGYDFGPTGSLVDLGVTASGGEGRQASSASALVASPRGDLVFASHNDSAQIEVYERDAAGALTPVAGSPFATAANPTVLAVHPSGRLLYTTNGSDLEGFAVDPATGALTPLPGSPFAVGSSPRGLAIDPRGDALYTGHMFGADVGVRVHTLDAQGIPTFASALDLSQLGSRPGKHVRVDPHGQRLLCSDLDQGLFVASIDPTTRALTLTASSPVDLGGFMSGLTTTPAGDLVYATVGTQLLGFRVDAAGALTPLAGSPFSGIGSVSLYLETDGGAHLFVSSRAEDDLRVFALDPLSGAPTALGSPHSNLAQGGLIGPVLALR